MFNISVNSVALSETTIAKKFTQMLTIIALISELMKNSKKTIMCNFPVQ